MSDFLKKTYLYSLLYLNKVNICVRDPPLVPTTDNHDIFKIHSELTNKLPIDDQLIKAVSPQLYNTNWTSHKPITAYTITNYNEAKFISKVQIPTGAKVIIGDEGIFKEENIQTDQYKLLETNETGYKRYHQNAGPDAKGILALCVFTAIDKIKLDNNYTISNSIIKSNSFRIESTLDIFMNIYYKRYVGGFQCYSTYDNALKVIHRSDADIFLTGMPKLSL